MKFDRNTVIGFVVLAGLFFGYFYFTNKQQSEHRKKVAAENAVKKAKEDSLRAITVKADTSNLKKVDSVIRQEKEGIFLDTGAKATETLMTLENEVVRITFTSKGGQPKKVELKNYKGQDSNMLRLASTDFDKISYRINTGKGGNNSSAETSDLFFTKIDTASSNGNKTISFTRESSDSSAYITHEFTLKPNDYMIDFKVKMK
jgi:YidC/Oxa1 family membrane protein insertase